jgi:uncharacterized membrane protein YfhO
VGSNPISLAISNYMNKFDIYVQNILGEATLNSRLNPYSQKSERDITVGQSAEDEFVKICKKNKLIAKPASLELERKHVDFVVFSGQNRAWADRPENQTVSMNKRSYVEVKDEKRHNSYFITEILNVRGELGWLYGEANYLAIKNNENNSFKMIKRYRLKTEIENRAGFKMVGKVPTDLATNQHVHVVQNKNESNLETKSFYRRDRDLVIYIPYTLVDSLIEFELK